MSKGIGYYTVHKDKIIQDVMDYLQQNPQALSVLARKMALSIGTLESFVKSTRPPYLATTIKIDNWLENERKEGRLK